MDGPFPRTEAKRLVRNFVCGECGGELIDPWGGAYGIKGQVVRCVASVGHQGQRPRGRETRRLYDGTTGRTVTYDVQTQQIVRRPDGTALALPDNEPGMVDRMTQAASLGKFPGKDVTPQQIRNLALMALVYQLDPLMDEIMPYQGHPYITISGRRRIDERAGKRPSIKISPMDVNTYNAYVRMGAIDDGDIVVVGEFTETATGQTVEATGRVLASETQGGPKRDHLPIVKWRMEMAWKRCEARGRKMLYGPLALPAGMDRLVRLIEEDDAGNADAEAAAITAPVAVVESTGEIVEHSPNPPEEPPPDLGVCQVHGNPWAATPRGWIGHRTDDGACWKDQPDEGPDDLAPASEDADAEGGALTDLQTRLGAFGWEWQNFQEEVLKMPWEEWLRLGQGVEVAWTRFEAFQSRQEE